MAIAFDNSTASSVASPVTSLTFSHTVSGNERLLFVGGFGDTDGNDTITGITYNGTSMTRLESGYNAPTGRFTYLYYLITPDTGTNDIVVSSSANIALAAIAASYTGAKQSGVPDSSNTQEVDSSSSVSISTTTVADNSWAILFSREESGTTFTPDSNTTEREDPGNGLHLSDSGSAITPAGSKTLGGTYSSSVCQFNIIASFAPHIPATDVKNDTNFFGINF